jgi:hypothetical protein
MQPSFALPIAVFGGQVMPTRSQNKAKLKPTNQKAAAKPTKSRAAAKPHAKRSHRGQTSAARPALPRKVEPGTGRVDVVGKLPPDIHVDPEITEGHPGYDETGPSEIIPPKA